MSRGELLPRELDKLRVASLEELTVAAAAGCRRFLASA